MIYIILIFFGLGVVAFRFINSTNYSNYPPGPISFPVIGSILAVLTSKPHEKLFRMKKKYGNIIAIDFGNFRGIVLNDFDTIKNVFILKELQNRPATEVLCIIRGKIPLGIALSSGETFEMQRAFVLKTLNNFGLRKNSIACLITEELQRLFLTLDKQLGIPIVNKDLFQLTAISALWTLISGEQGKSEDSEFISMLHDVSKASSGFNIFTLFFPQISKLFPDLSGWNNLITGGTGINAYSIKSILAHKKTFKPNVEPNDLIEAYLQKIAFTQDENSSFFGITGDRNLQSVISDLLGAGTDTVSTSLSWLLALSVYYPKVQEKVHLEIDRVIGRNRLPCLEDRPKLPYMESVILEILRLSSLFPLSIPHECSEDVKLDKYIIPKGTIVIANFYAALHDPKLWNEPEEFIPERFLNEDGWTIDRNIARNADIIFSHGKRSCPGEKIAKDELFIFITGLCQRYIFLRDPLHNYDQKIESELGITLNPRPHSLIIQKR